MQLTLNVGGPTDWVLSNRTVDAAGKPAALPTWFAACVPPPTSTDKGPASRQTLDACLTRLTREGYKQRIVSNPPTASGRSNSRRQRYSSPSPGYSPGSASGGPGIDWRDQAQVAFQLVLRGRNRSCCPALRLFCDHGKLLQSRNHHTRGVAGQRGTQLGGLLVDLHDCARRGAEPATVDCTAGRARHGR